MDYVSAIVYFLLDSKKKKKKKNSDLFSLSEINGKHE